MIENLKLLLDKKFYYFILLIFGMIISFIIELFSITLVPVFISSLINFESFLNFLPDEIHNFVQKFDETSIIIFSAIFIIFSYIGNGDNFSTTKQINISTFEKYLNASEVSKVTIINKTLAEVTLTENALLNEILGKKA